MVTDVLAIALQDALAVIEQRVNVLLVPVHREDHTVKAVQQARLGRIVRKNVQKGVRTGTVMKKEPAIHVRMQTTGGLRVTKHAALIVIHNSVTFVQGTVKVVVKLVILDLIAPKTVQTVRRNVASQMASVWEAAKWDTGEIIAKRTATKTVTVHAINKMVHANPAKPHGTVKTAT